MKKYIYTVGTFVFALAMSGLSTIALAESNRGEGDANVQVTAVTAVRVSDDRDAAVTVRARVDDESTNSDEQKGSEKVRGEDRNEQEIRFELEDDGDRAFSFNDLKQKIENRRHELEDEEASTTPKFKNTVKNANEVRLAVHALLASRDLFGGSIGEQISEIAKHMNDSVATTTNAEARIQSRGFLLRLLFGGDSRAADVIAQAVAQNQQRIDDLTTLLGGTNVSADIQVVLKAQITALQTAQARLQALAEKEQKMWGLFSWRFGK